MLVGKIRERTTFSLGVRRESDVSSQPIWRIFLVFNPRFFVVLTAIFGSILAQILRFLQLYEHVQHSSKSSKLLFFSYGTYMGIFKNC
jgi:hypothetical protein